jgi:ferredoxin
MEESMKETVKRWLQDGTIDVFLGYRVSDGHPLPHCFVKGRLEEVDDLMVSDARYSLEKIATHMVARKPDIKIGMLARDCSQRALTVLTLWNQIEKGSVHTITVNCCPSSLKKQPDCSYLDPKASGSLKRRLGIDNSAAPDQIERLSASERFSRWMYEFQKCIKCYGCRNICPVCFCSECSLEHEELIGAGRLPPEVPLFHLVRAAHMAGRCIDCGLCEDACPADIPLRLLYRKVNGIVCDTFGYDTGTAQAQSPFSLVGDHHPTLTPRPMHPVGEKENNRELSN